MQTVALNDGVAIPQIGFGTFQIPAGAETEKAVAFALSCGCRHIEEAVSALDITLDAEEIAALEAPYVPHIKTGAF